MAVVITDLTLEGSNQLHCEEFELDVSAARNHMAPSSCGSLRDATVAVSCQATNSFHAIAFALELPAPNITALLSLPTIPAPDHKPVSRSSLT
jgi:hypothetical protein